MVQWLLIALCPPAKDGRQGSFDPRSHGKCRPMKNPRSLQHTTVWCWQSEQLSPIQCLSHIKSGIFTQTQRQRQLGQLQRAAENILRKRPPPPPPSSNGPKCTETHSQIHPLPQRCCHTCKAHTQDVSRWQKHTRENISKYQVTLTTVQT